MKANMKTADLRKKTTEELGTELLELRRAQFSLKMQLATQQLNKVDQIAKIKRDIARVKTVLGEKVKQA
ncbi:50S ribosomal protein L29 [Methylophilaceae bacterium]|jgi:large subunit ribosomal protein L29|nr:50S ribosomal protein L29 [Methylophilaceae bacterium]